VTPPDAEPTLRGPAPGQRVFGRYILQALLGRGGMGVVWRAHDEKLAEDIALKFLPEVVRWDPGAFEDLKAETRRARQLTHPNIIRVHDFVDDAAGAAIAMELVEGRTLTAVRLEKESALLDPADITPWLPQLCAALDYAHGQARVVHRDLKPTNILLARDGTVKVGDFGIARSLADSITRVSMMSAGTLVYMSPQQAMGEEPSPADDIYALGATLYELLTGKPPFHTGDVRLQLFQRPPEPIAARRVRLPRGADAAPIPRAWEETLAACLAKSAAARPASAGAVAARLAPASGGPVSGGPARHLRRLRGSLRGPIVAAAFVVLAAGGGFAAWRRWHRSADAAWPSDATRAIAAWNFDGNGHDDSGHDLDFINAASVVPVRDRHGRIDRALHFNGVAAIETPDAPPLRWGGAEPFSVSLWLRPDALRPEGNHVIGSAPTRVGDPQWQLSVAESGEVRLFLGRFQETGGVGLTGGSRVRAGEWTHVAVVSDGGTAQLWVDGRAGIQAQLPRLLRGPAPVSSRLRLGTSDLYARTSFSGDLDELRVWRRALAPAEVAALAAPEAPPRFATTRAAYSDRDELAAAIVAEFGAGANLADWDELRRWRSDDPAALGRELELEVGGTGLWLQRAGQRLWQAPRHYMLSRFAGAKPGYFLAHDELGGFQLALGSWYDVRQRALVRLPPPTARSERLARAAGGEAIARRFEPGEHVCAVAASWRGALARESGANQVQLRLRDGRRFLAACAPLPGERLAVSLGAAGQPEIARQIGATLGDFQFEVTVTDGWLRFRAVAVVGSAPIFQEQVPLGGVRAEDIAELGVTGPASAGLTIERAGAMFP
jgi:hypothetical protein